MLLPVAPTDAVVPVTTRPGGAVVLHGAWTVASQDLIIDACQSGHTSGPTGAGAFDLAAGGWQVQSRDWTTHTCRIVATGAPAPVCAQSGSTVACLPSR